MARPRRLQPHPDNPEIPEAPGLRPWLCNGDPAYCSSPTDRHDDYSAYSVGCRSGAAMLDEYRYRKAGRIGNRPSRLISRVGAHRRLQALSAIGWSTRDIAERLGRAPRTVENWRSRDNTKMTTRLLSEIAEVYETLSMTPGPNAGSRRRAAVHGWAPPLAWDDEDIDDPDACPRAGEQVDVDAVKVTRCVDGWLPLAQLNHLEQEAAVARGRSEAIGQALAERLGTSTRQIERVTGRARARAARSSEREVRAS